MMILATSQWVKPPDPLLRTLRQNTKSQTPWKQPAISAGPTFLLVPPERDQVGSSFEYTCIPKVWHACRQSRLECLRSSLSSGVGCGSGQGAREPCKQSAKHLSVIHCRYTEASSAEQRGWEGGLV